MPVSELLKRRSFLETNRSDTWWIQPLVVLLGLTGFIIYTTWAAFQGTHYYFDGGGAHYLSPFYSPLLFGQPNEPRWLDAVSPSWWPNWLFFSPAFMVLAGPAGMRFTCYYYRGAYYKAFWGDPPSCTVGEPRTVYRGEQKLPLLFQNLHRYFFYFAGIFVLILAHDAYEAMWFTGSDGAAHFGIGIGTLVLTINALLLGAYTFGCHCARHIVGGHLDRFSHAPIRKNCYNCVSNLNSRHMLWAWCSLVWVASSDIYIRLLCSGVLSDRRLI